VARRAKSPGDGRRSKLPSIYIIGAGNVGLGLALALGKATLFVRTSARARAMRHLWRGPIEVGQFGEALARAAVVLVAVTDAAVPEVGAALGRATLLGGAVVAHTAGALPASALGILPGALVAGLHPLVACPDPRRAAKNLRGAAFGVEGTPTARRALARVIGALGGRAISVTGDKARYHAALVLASNLVVALLHLARREGAAAGMTDLEALDALAKGALEQAAELGPQRALTGPLVRGDVATVLAHLEHLGHAALPAYRALSRVALDLAKERGLDPDTAARLTSLLGEAGQT
jgi:predicted short-subunit dehydrogenase-like oxidoreductase (DUF2520 family)